MDDERKFEHRLNIGSVHRGPVVDVLELADLVERFVKEHPALRVLASEVTVERLWLQRGGDGP